MILNLKKDISKLINGESMYQYLKILEDWDGRDIVFFDLIGKVKNLNFSENKFTLWAEDTNLTLDCTLIPGCYVNTVIKSGDTIIVDAYAIDKKLRIRTVNKPPFKLSGSLQKDILILTNTVNSMCSVQQQNGHITIDEYGELQQMLFDFKDKYHEILFFHSSKKEVK